jgi:hypothetical protein
MKALEKRIRSVEARVAQQKAAVVDNQLSQKLDVIAHMVSSGDIDGALELNGVLDEASAGHEDSSHPDG